MHAMMELQLRNHCSNVVGAARSYGGIPFICKLSDNQLQNNAHCWLRHQTPRQSSRQNSFIYLF